MYSVKDTPHKGTSIFAHSYVSPGTSILSEEPFEAVLNSDTSDAFSHWSFKPSEQLQRCVGCKFAWYANRKEQKLAWSHGHREECRALQRQKENLPGPSVRLMARILWKRMQTGSGADFKSVERLMTHWQDLTDQKKIMYGHAAHATRRFMNSEELGELPSTKEIAQLFSMLSCNSHTICDEEEHPIGLGLFPTGALVNHSCTPSAVQVFLGKSIHFRSLRNLQAGEEVTIAYIELGQMREERRTVLLERYHFDINQEGSAQPQALVARKEDLTPPTSTLLSIWQNAPFPMDKADEQLSEICSASSKRIGGRMSGFLIQEDSEATAGFFSDLDRTQSEQDGECGSTTTSLGISAQVPDSLAKGGSPRKRILVDCWGPIFLHGEAPCWKLVESLTSIARAWLSACQKANAAYQAGQPFCMADLDAAMGSEAKQASLTEDGITFGSHHVLRARLTEVKFRIAQQYGLWREALRCGLQLQTFYDLVYPKVFPLRGLHEAALAKIADLLLQPAIAAQSAQKALEILTVTRPESSCLNDLFQIKRNLLRQN